jgi:hypothetical protein
VYKEGVREKEKDKDRGGIAECRPSMIMILYNIILYYNIIYIYYTIYIIILLYLFIMYYVVSTYNIVRYNRHGS